MKASIWMVLFVMNGSVAFAEGGQSGNGGGAHYCPHPTANQKKWEAYDLWEVKHPLNGSSRSSLLIKDWDGKTTREKYLLGIVNKLKRKSLFMANSFERISLLLHSSMAKNAVTQDGRPIRLSKVPDAGDLAVEEGCEYYQLVNWVDDPADLKVHDFRTETILRKEKAYEQMDPLNQAANDAHETLYKIKRAYFLVGQTAESSADVRKLVGQLFSDSNSINSDLLGVLGAWLGDFRHDGPRGDIWGNRVRSAEHNSRFLVFENRYAPEQIAKSELVIINTGTIPLAVNVGAMTVNPGDSGVISSVDNPNDSDLWMFFTVSKSEKMMREFSIAGLAAGALQFRLEYRIAGRVYPIKGEFTFSESSRYGETPADNHKVLYRYQYGYFTITTMNPKY